MNTDERRLPRGAPRDHELAALLLVLGALAVRPETRSTQPHCDRAHWLRREVVPCSSWRA